MEGRLVKPGIWHVVVIDTQAEISSSRKTKPVCEASCSFLAAGFTKLLSYDSHVCIFSLPRTCFLIEDSFGVETSSPPSKPRAGRNCWTHEHLQVAFPSRASSFTMQLIVLVTAEDRLNFLGKGKADMGYDIKAAVAILGCQKSLPFCVCGSSCWARLQDLRDVLSFVSGLMVEFIGAE